MPRVVSNEEQVDDIKDELAEMKAELERLRREKTELIRQNNLLQRRHAGNGDSLSNAQLRLEVQDVKATLAEMTKKLDGVAQETGRLSELHLQTIEEVRRMSLNAPGGRGGGRQEQRIPARINATETMIIFGGSGGGVKSDVYMLNYAENTWDVFAFPENMATWCRAAVHLNGEIYFIGGVQERRETRNCQDANYSTHVCKLTSNFNWEELPLTCYNHLGVAKSCVAYENCLWIIGGSEFDFDCDNLYEPSSDHDLLLDSGTKKVEKYEPATNSWMEMAELNYDRLHASAIVIGQKIYVCGGIPWDDIVECFDPTSQRWIQICKLVPRARPALIPDGNNFIIFGDTDLNEEVIKINVDSKTAIGMPSLPEKRANFSAFRTGNTILAIGGHIKSKKQTRAYVHTETTPTVLTYNGKVWRKDGPALPNPRADYVSAIIPIKLGNKLKNKFG